MDAARRGGTPGLSYAEGANNQRTTRWTACFFTILKATGRVAGRYEDVTTTIDTPF
jgi:hypothetical protein